MEVHDPARDPSGAYWTWPFPSLPAKLSALEEVGLPDLSHVLAPDYGSDLGFRSKNVLVGPQGLPRRRHWAAFLAQTALSDIWMRFRHVCVCPLAHSWHAGQQQRC